MADPPYDWKLSARAERDLSQLPERVVPAALELISCVIVANPERLGGPLHDRWKGCLSARLGEYRVVYRVDHPARMVEVARIAHRGKVYHQ